MQYIHSNEMKEQKLLTVAQPCCTSLSQLVEKRHISRKRGKVHTENATNINKFCPEFVDKEQTVPVPFTVQV